MLPAAAAAATTAAAAAAAGAAAAAAAAAAATAAAAAGAAAAAAVVDQWFSTISKALQTIDEDISTLPKMRKYLGERFKCPVIELDAQ